MISCEIKLEDRLTFCHAETIEELLEKVADFHTMSDFERIHFTKKGTLQKELNSGWYLKEKNHAD
jgi:hypothetical protein